MRDDCGKKKPACACPVRHRLRYQTNPIRIAPQQRSKTEQSVRGLGAAQIDL
jgi:hypothetical protein